EAKEWAGDRETGRRVSLAPRWFASRRRHTHAPRAGSRTGPRRQASSLRVWPRNERLRSISPIAKLETLADRPTTASAAGHAITRRLAIAAIRSAARARRTLGNDAVAVDLPPDTGGAVLVRERAGAAASAKRATDIDVGGVIAGRGG